MDNFDLVKFNELKKQTEIIYKKVVSIHCPALKSEVILNSDGFHHLRYDSCRVERDKHVQQSKFLYFDKAVDMIKLSTTIQEYRRSLCPVGSPDRSGLRKASVVELFGFFSVISFSKQIRIKVVVRRIGIEKGNYHFWSVMPFWTLTNNHRVIGSKDIEDG